MTFLINDVQTHLLQLGAHKKSSASTSARWRKAFEFGSERKAAFIPTTSRASFGMAIGEQQRLIDSFATPWSTSIEE